MRVDAYVESGEWREAVTGTTVTATDAIEVDVPPHDVRVLLRDHPVSSGVMKHRLIELMRDE